MAKVQSARCRICKRVKPDCVQLVNGPRESDKPQFTCRDCLRAGGQLQLV